jgi:hypothetical protein
VSIIQSQVVLFSTDGNHCVSEAVFVGNFEKDLFMTT